MFRSYIVVAEGAMRGHNSKSSSMMTLSCRGVGMLEVWRKITGKNLGSVDTWQTCSPFKQTQDDNSRPRENSESHHIVDTNRKCRSICHQRFIKQRVHNARYVLYHASLGLYIRLISPHEYLEYLSAVNQPLIPDLPKLCCGADPKLVPTWTPW